MSLRVMLVIGAMVLVMAAAALFGRPEPSTSPQSAEPMGNGAVSHGASESAGP